MTRTEDDLAAQRRDEVIKRMLNTPPKPRTSLGKQKTASSDADAPSEPERT